MSTRVRPVRMSVQRNTESPEPICDRSLKREGAKWRRVCFLASSRLSKRPLVSLNGDCGAVLEDPE